MISTNQVFNLRIVNKNSLHAKSDTKKTPPVPSNDCLGNCLKYIDVFSCSSKLDFCFTTVGTFFKHYFDKRI